ncbi:PIN domain-containing protein [uncultured Polaribacter sp.]|uniref:type II toxin-antitoxin system VapC family toxin n=1 Tax=uncultured Polaribacter sp. TaxID=174711 RepID=UPI00262B8CCC|nr:PIN domain-containing protein [uncultured Polaribacter sp.]
MKVIFVDTNIIIDFITKRKLFYKEANKIFSLADTKKIILKTSSLSFANAYYICSRLKLNSDKELRSVFASLKSLIEIIPITSEILDRGLSDDLFKDFEDGLQYFSAISSNCEIILTRDLKDFKNAKLPVMTADNYISGL